MAGEKTSTKGVPCPGKCGRKYLWDWCQDKYITTDGQYCLVEETDSKEIYICQCGEHLGYMSLTGDDEGEVHNCKEFENIDWEDHVYEPCGGC